MKKGFTLIELLGVITLLGLIALIAVPAVSKSIKNKKEELYEDQIEFIISSAKLWATDNKLELSELLDGETKTITLKDLISNGYIDDEIKNPLTDEVFPTCVEIKIKRVSNNYEYTVTNLDCKVEVTTTTNIVTPVISNVIINDTNNEAEFTIEFEEGKSGSKTVCEYGTTEGNYTEKVETTSNKCIITNLTPKTTYYYKVVSSNGNKTSEEHKGNFMTDTYLAVVYYNPTAGAKCGASDAVSITGTKSGCMKWYAYKDNGDTYDMILDHNTTPSVAWNSTKSNAEMKEVKAALEADTTGWVVAKQYDGLNARLITADEVAEITGAKEALNWDSKTIASSNFYFDGAKGTDTTWKTQIAKTTGASDYAWLFDNTYACTDSGCDVEDATTYGYWTSTPLASGTIHAYVVNRLGYLSDGSVDLVSIIGVRPVITVSKSVIK